MSTLVLMMKKNILFLCPFPKDEAAVQRLKFEPHYKQLIKNGYNLEAQSFINLELWNIVYKKGNFFKKTILTLICFFKRIIYLKSNLKNYDIIYISLWLFPFGPRSLDKFFLKRCKHVIYDIEDNLLQPQPKGANPISKWLKSKLRIYDLILIANKIIASSPQLAKKCNEIAKKNISTYIPPTLEESRFIPISKKSNPNKPITIGWTGTFSSKPYLDLIAPFLKQLSLKREFIFRLIGNFDYHCEGVNIEVITWNAQEEIEQLNKLDIGLYPLPMNNWIEGKSGLKAMQYMALGIPPVSTAIGNVLSFVKDHHDGRLVYNNEWVDVLSDLIDNPTKRKEIGENARKTFLERFSTSAIYNQYETSIRGALK